MNSSIPGERMQRSPSPMGSTPPLLVRIQGSDRSLVPGPSYSIGRDAACDVVITDDRVSWRHAVLGLEDDHWVLADNGSTNGIYAEGRRVDRIEISGECQVRLGHPVDGMLLTCTIRAIDPGAAVGTPTKKWRLVVFSDPELLDEVAANEVQFGKSAEEINFFAQLANSRGGGISVIGDSEHTERIRRVMLPWYAPWNQRTQFSLMKEQASRLVTAWSAIPDAEAVDARSWMERYALEVSGRGACGYNFGLLDGSGDPHPFAAAVPESTKESIARVAEPRPDFTLFAGRARRARRKRYLRHNEELFATADALACTPARSGSRRICSLAW